jgi:all-trans-8'-apo-beta-carotenal 15,15'-oxygenase
MHAAPSPHQAPSMPPTRRQIIETEFQRNLPREHGFEPLQVEGSIPADLVGTLYRNGPGMFESFGRHYSHIFEADGAITAVQFCDGQARGAARVTASPGLARERAAGKVLFGSAAPWPRRVYHALRYGPKNTANTNVIEWQGRLFALMEAGRPIEIAPADLTTLGETDLGGLVGSSFSAHPHRVGSRRTRYNFGLRYGRRPKLRLYALPDQGSGRRLGSVPLDSLTMVHDFIATEDHLVFFIHPVRFDLARAALAVGPFESLFRWEPNRGSEIIVVPIAEPQRPIRFRTDAFWQWHFANAFERDGTLFVDYVHFPDLTSLSLGTQPVFEVSLQGTLHRAEIAPRARRFRSRPLSDTPIEFPRVHPDREGTACRWLWATIMDGDGGLVAFDLDRGREARYELPSGQWASEPVFVPRAGASEENDGYLLVLIYDGSRHASHVAVFDAPRLADGPVARAWFDHPIPSTFHGNWVVGQ